MDLCGSRSVNYLYQYQYLYRPRACIVEDGGRQYLEVEGMGERIEVRRVSKKPAPEEKK
jgi:hypothetical protein